MTTDDILNRFENVREAGRGRWKALCPAHADTSPSLSIREDGRGLVLCCRSHQCTQQEILSAVGLKAWQLFNDPQKAGLFSPGSSPLPVFGRVTKDTLEQDLLMIDSLMGHMPKREHDPVAFYGWTETELAAR